ncbi:MAG: 4Fe-4S dicluster domain-containing protein [Candidatus Aminicenantes bacterium]|nr:4Fe-4S dicluster domain-containing protein [Candidatus Aminicenantes bacterium]
MNAAKNGQNTEFSLGKILPAEKGVAHAVIGFLKNSLEKKHLDAVLIPSKIPNTEAYTWLLVQDVSLLDSCHPLPPVMTVQGGKALSSLTKRGDLEEKVAAVMRPCEVRAAVELFKLKQIDLNNITLISIDCPGAMPLRDYIDDPANVMEAFENTLEKWEENDSLRPVCQICHHFSLLSPTPSALQNDSIPKGEAENSPSDLHIGLMSDTNDKIFIIPTSSKGQDLCDKMDLGAREKLEDWESKVTEIRERKFKKRTAFNADLQTEIEGADKFAAVFDDCINCHNCQSACPICYCQQCYFDSQLMHLTPEDYLERAKKRGALRFPLDTLFFHIGRMSHMALSCVSCGACEDACPASIPVARVFTMMGDRTQEYFDYTPGRDRAESLPLQAFEESEFEEMETPHEGAETPSGEAGKNV